MHLCDSCGGVLDLLHCRLPGAQFKRHWAEVVCPSYVRAVAGDRAIKETCKQRTTSHKSHSQVARAGEQGYLSSLDGVAKMKVTCEPE